MLQLTPRMRVLVGRRYRQVGLLVLGAIFILGLSLVLIGKPAQAATNNTLNFQARLQTNTGALVPDGYYNIEFKLYDALSGGSLLWTETYYDSDGGGAATDNRVRVKNGYLTVNLGTLTTFPSTINWDQRLWISMNVGGSAHTATPTWNGEMSPRLSLTGVPYAFRAGELAKLNTGNGFTSVLRLQNATGGNQIFEIPNQGTGNTFTLLTTNTADANYIQNTTSPQTANFNITGDGVIGDDLSLSGDFVQSGSGTFATATGAVSLNGDTTVAAGKTLKFANSSNSNLITLQSGVTSPSYTLTLPTTLGASGDCLKDTNGSGVLGFASCGGGSGVTTVGAFSGSSQTNGATISGTTITFGPADATNPGMVSTGSQTIAGAKTFSGNIIGQAGLSVTGAATLTADAVGTIPLTVQGAASQTANLLEVKNQSGGTTVLSIAKDGTGIFQGVQPASTAGNGTNAGNGSGNSFEIKAANGGNTTGTFNTAGNGGAITITSGNGGVGTNGGIVNGGNGGNIVIQGGTGGAGVGGGSTGVHGNVLLQATDIGYVGIRTTTNTPANPLTINDRVEASSTGTNDSLAQLMVFMGSSNSNKGIVAQGRASQTGNLFEGQNNSGTPLFSVSAAGAIVGVGINSGTGLIQGTGGATITGAVALNTTGSANTQIGNATGTFQLDSNTIDISNAGAISGVTGLTMASGNFLQSGTGTFGTGTGAISLNGDTTIANDKRLSIGSTSGLASALAVTAPGGTELNVRTNGGLRVSVGNTANCTSGRFCIEQEVNGATAGTFYNNYNVQTINSSGGSNVITGVGQSISISDTGSTSGNSIRGLFMDTTGTTNASTEINGLWVRNPSGNSGNLLRLQTGTTDRYLVSNTAALSHTYGATGSSTAHTLTLNSASGTQANGILVDRNGSGGTTTNGIHITNTAGAITHGLTFSGTFSTNLINAPNFTVTNAGGITGSALTLTSAGNFATQRNTTDFTTTGTSNDVNLGTGAVFRLNGASAQTITGLAGGADGRRITIINAAAQAATISNNSGSSTAANRIITGTGANLSLPAGGSIELVYDSSASLWRVIGDVAGGSGVTTVGTFSGSSQTNGASISGNTITFGPADATNPGMVSTGSQTIAGAKTFTGNMLVQPAADSATAFRVQNTGNINQLTVDTNASRVILGTSGGDTVGTLLVLGNKTNATEPTGVAGAMYYNSALNDFRCYTDHWQSCIHTARTSYHYVNEMLSYWGDCPFPPTSTSNCPDVAAYSSGGGSVTFDTANSPANHPGINTLNISTNASFAALDSAVNTAQGIILLGNGDYWRYETEFKVNTLSTSAQRYIARIGFNDNLPGDAVDGCFIKYSDNVNSGKFQANCGSNSSYATACDINITVATGKWYRASVVVNSAGTQATFTVYNVTDSVAGTTCNITSNIPTASGRQTSHVFSIDKTVGNTAASWDVDYIELEAQFSGR